MTFYGSYGEHVPGQRDGVEHRPDLKYSQKHEVFDPKKKILSLTTYDVYENAEEAARKCKISTSDLAYEIRLRRLFMYFEDWGLGIEPVKRSYLTKENTGRKRVCFLNKEDTSFIQDLVYKYGMTEVSTMIGICYTSLYKILRGEPRGLKTMQKIEDFLSGKTH